MGIPVFTVPTEPAEMNRKEQFKRNHELFKLFIQQSIDSPDLREQVPGEADLLFLPDTDPELREANTSLADELRTAGKTPTFIRSPTLLKPSP